MVDRRIRFHYELRRFGKIFLVFSIIIREAKELWVILFIDNRDSGVRIISVKSVQRKFVFRAQIHLDLESNPNRFGEVSFVL